MSLTCWVVRESVYREMNGEAEIASQGERRIREEECTIAVAHAGVNVFGGDGPVFGEMDRRAFRVLITSLELVDTKERNFL